MDLLSFNLTTMFVRVITKQKNLDLVLLYVSVREGERGSEIVCWRVRVRERVCVCM